MSQPRKPFGPYLIQKVLLQTVFVLGIIGFSWAIIQDTVLRWDLTEDQRFSISEASHKIAAELPDRLTIRAYFTEKLPERVVPYYRQVMDILDEYEAVSGGKIKVEQFDPSENSAIRNEAEGYGIQPVDLFILEATARKKVVTWGSIVLLYRDKKSEIINIARRYPQGYEGLSGLEYELSSRIWQLTNDKPTLGITGHLASPPPGGNPMNPMANQPRPMFQGLRSLLGDAFRIEDVDLNQAQPDPAEIPCLMVVRPKDFNEIQTFRLDQYLMKGGRVIVFVTQGELAPGMMGQGMRLDPFKTGLEEWLSFHGLRVPNEVVMHRYTAFEQPRRTQTPLGVIPVATPAPCFPIVTRKMEGCFDDENPATHALRSALFLWPHPVELLEGKIDAGVTATVLVQSDERQSWRWKDMNRLDGNQILDGIESGKDTPTKFYASPLIVGLDGTFDSFYKDRPVPPSLASEGSDAPGEGSDEGEDEGDGEKKDGDAEKKAKGPDVIQRSQPTNLVVVGNALFISDMTLANGGESEVGRQASQVAFNLVDWLARSSDLIALRAKKYSNRKLRDAVEETLGDLEKEYDEGKITLDEFKARLTEAEDVQKAERKAARRNNILLPSALVVFAGLIVLVIRVSRRSTNRDVPTAVAPPSAAAGAKPDDHEEDLV
jgi:ABC-2 type transport system permease protein